MARIVGSGIPASGQSQSIWLNSLAAIQAQLALGKKVYVDYGTYTVNSSGALSVIQSGSGIVGRGFGKYQGSDTDGVYFTYSGDVSPIRCLKADNTLLENVTLEGFKLENTGGNKTVPAIYLKDFSYGRMKNVYVNMQGANCPDGVVKLDAVNQFSDHNVFDQVHVRGFGTGIGFSLQASATKWTNVNNFYSCRAFNGAVGWDLQNEAGKTGDVDNNKIIGCHPDTISGFGFKDNGVDNEFSNNTFMDTVGTAYTYAGQSGSNHATIKNNHGLWTGLGVQNLGTNLNVDRHVQLTADIDLSAAATDIFVFHADTLCSLVGYTIIYTEASSADAGVSIDIGRYQDGVALDDDYFDTTTSLISQALGAHTEILSSGLTNKTILHGDTVTVGTAGGKTGTGNVRVILKICEE